LKESRVRICRAVEDFWWDFSGCEEGVSDGNSSHKQRPLLRLAVAASINSLNLSVHEQGDQNDDRDGYTEKE